MAPWMLQQLAKRVVVPDQASVLDWVFADGPPGKAAACDNNNRRDFHALVPGSVPEELYWAEEEHRIFQKLQEERRSREALRAKDHYKQYGLSKSRVAFTINNLEFGAHLIAKAMAYSDKAATVSHTYSKEVSYTSENVVEGKGAAKEALLQRLGLRKVDVPPVGINSRLTHQKGIHLIKHALSRTLECGGQPQKHAMSCDILLYYWVQHLILAYKMSVNLANHLHSSHNDRARFCLTYDEPLSHLIYAGADFILVPSILSHVD
ncbi:hypothetical protein MLD38_039801 [Melastoma candidum]|uniref:Uncharacterized protein n=1 Tax=Melastoma candidum TaxID=119954 RepID=A0ACB9L3N1_9MYRT|nr:hypothetical protein MLD38_039801 [Melastoma candidum]